MGWRANSVSHSKHSKTAKIMKLNDVRSLKMRLLAEGSSSVVGYSMAGGDKESIKFSL